MAIIGPNIGLAIWNTGDDLWNTDQLRNNWARLEFHDHSVGRGMPIPTEGIQDGAVTAAKLAPGANVVQDGAVIPSKFGALPAAKAYRSSVTTLANGVETTLSFDIERFDTANLHDPGVNPERFTAPIAGTYMITLAVVVSAAPTTGVLRLGCYKNGTTNALAYSSLSANAVAHTLTTFARLAFNDYVVFRILNTTGAAVDVSVGQAASEERQDGGMIWMAP